MKLRKKQTAGVETSIILSGLSTTMSASTAFKIEGNEGIVVTVNGINVTEAIIFGVTGGNKAASELTYKDEITSIDFSSLSFSVDADDSAKITANFKESDLSGGLTFS